MSYINFESARVKEAERAEKKKAREGILKKAEEDYYHKKQKEEQARLRGDDKWILPSVEARIKGDKDKEKKKKHKKKKKKTKKKRKSSTSDSEDDSEGEEEWVEKSADVSSKTGVGTLSEENNGKKTDPLSSETEPEMKPVSKQSQEKSQVPTERDEWMTLPGLFPSVSREQLRQQSGHLSKAEEQRQKDRYMLDNLGQSDRELNPYWKDGGTGLPQEKEHERDKKELHTLPAKSVGDQGVDWLRRALKRAKEQAAEEGRTLEEVAAERWGSLEKLETLIAEAEGKSRRQRKQGSNQREYDKYEQESRRSSWKKNTHDTDGTRRPDSQRRSDRSDQDRIISGSRSFHKPRDDDSPYRHRDNSESTSRSFRSPRDDDRLRDEEVGHSKRDWNSERHPKRSFQKPGEDIDILERGDFRIHEKNVSDSSKYRSSASSGNWRKKTSIDQKVYDVSDKQKYAKSSNKAESSSSSSPSSSDDDNDEEKKGEESTILTDKEMNDLGAKLVKAEILGNETLAKELKKKLDAARAVRTMKPTETSDTKSAVKAEEETVVLTRTDSKGFMHPIKQTGQHTEPVGGRRRKQKMETHVEGKRVRYFADDDKYSLKDLFEREKMSTARDEEEMISKLAGKVTDNDDMDDIFAERVRQKESDGKIQARERSQAIKQHKIVDRVLENCNWCFDSKAMLKHLIVAIANKVYLCLPPHQSLTEGHCFIVPMYHMPCATQLDEDVWSELQTFRKTLTKMFREKLDQDVIFFETAMYLRKFPHMMLECVPVPRETGDLAPIYFKKAILECETEWATNKKLVDLKGKDVRRAIPKGLPYFAVDFGLDSGFAHVIEDEKMFPRNFAQEIIGGMMDLDHSIWRKQRRENFDLQRKKVMQFSEWWKSYDFTTAKQENSSDSD